MADKDTAQADPVSTDEQLKNDAKPEATDAQAEVNATDNKQEDARQLLEKKEMEVRMLRNKADALQKEKEEAERKELAEKEDFRKLSEAEKARADELQRRLEEREKQELVEKSTSKIESKFSSEVRDLAKEAGIQFNADLDPEEAEADYEKRLTAIQNRIGGQAAPEPSNPKPGPKGDPRQELMDRHVGGDKKAFRDLLRQLPSVDQIAKDLTQE